MTGQICGLGKDCDAAQHDPPNSETCCRPPSDPETWPGTCAPSYPVRETLEWSCGCTFTQERGDFTFRHCQREWTPDDADNCAIGEQNLYDSEGIISHLIDQLRGVEA